MAETPFDELQRTGVMPEEWSLLNDVDPTEGMNIIVQHRRAQERKAQQPRPQISSLGELRALAKRLKGVPQELAIPLLRQLSGISKPVDTEKLEQQKQLIEYRQRLMEPQLRARAELQKMIQARQAASDEEKRQQFEQTQQSRSQAQNLQRASLLSRLIQQDTSGQLGKKYGPILLEMLQSGGINLAPPTQSPSTTNPASRGNTYSPRPGVKITREE